MEEILEAQQILDAQQIQEGSGYVLLCNDLLDDALTDLEREQFAYRSREHEGAVQRNIGRNTVTFSEQQVVTLRIPDKYRLKGERTRMPVRIFKKYQTGRYKLICAEGWLEGSWAHGELNAAGKWSKIQLQLTGKGLMIGLPNLDTFGVVIDEHDHIEAVSLSKAVQEMNERGPISARQQATRIRKTPAPTATSRHARACTLSSERNIDPRLWMPASMPPLPIPSSPRYRQPEKRKRWIEYVSQPGFRELPIDTVDTCLRRRA